MNKNLRKEYRKLNKEYKNVIDKMFRYLGAFSLNSYAYQGITEELVGMASENQQRKISVEEVFGIDYIKFCDSLVENTVRKSIIEKIVEGVMVITTSFAIAFLFFILTKYIVPGNTFIIHGITLIAPLSKILEYAMVGLMGGIGALFMGRRAFAPIGKTFAIYMVGYIAIANYGIGIIERYINTTIQINIVLWIVVPGVIATATYFINKYIAKKNMGCKV